MGLQGFDQLLVQPLFAGQGAVLRGKGLVLEGLEFRRDETFGILERLAALVVGRHLVELAGGDLDVETVHAVVLHAQVGDAGTLALTRFQRQQEFGAVGLDAAQLVQIGIETVGNHAAIADIDSGIGLQRGLQQAQHVGRRLQLGCDGGQQAFTLAFQYLQQAAAQAFRLRQGAQQAGQFARFALAQRQTRADAFHVADAMQHSAQILEAALAQQADGLKPLLCRRAGTFGMQQPVLERAAAHAAFAGIQQAEQGRAGFAAQGLRQLQVALGGEWQVDERIVALHLQAVQMGDGAALGVLGVGQQRSGSGVRLRHVISLPGVEVGAAQLLGELAQAQAAVEGEAGALGNDETLHGPMLLPLLQLGALGGADIGAVEHLGRLDAADPGIDLVGCAFGQHHAALRQAHPG